MEDYPRTIEEFRKRFCNEQDCIEYLIKFKWPDGLVCKKCEYRDFYKTKRGLFQCRKCGFQMSVTSGTIFHDTRKPLTEWFEAMWHITSQKYGANALGLQRTLGFGSYHTAWEWLHRFRHAMVRPERTRLSGIVEVDETLIGGKATGKRGRGADKKAVVMIAVEDTSKGKVKGIGRIRLAQVPDASTESIYPFIDNNISKQTIVRTDDWNGYNNIQHNGYEHIVVDSKQIKICHLVASLLKRWLTGTYQGAVRFKHLDYYLDEFTFRFNRRKSSSRGKLFYRLVQQAVITEPVRRSEIASGKIGKLKPNLLEGNKENVDF